MFLIYFKTFVSLFSL